MAAEQAKWHRVMLNTIVRKEVTLDSERLRILPMGSKVLVVKTLERRVKISDPIEGWCSLKSSNGDTILTPLEAPTGSNVPPTPSANTNVATKFSNFTNRKEAAQLNAEKTAAKISTFSADLPEDSRRKVEELNRISEKKALEEKLLKVMDEMKETGNAEQIEELEKMVREREEQLAQAEVFGQMAKAASLEIENIKKQHEAMFGNVSGAADDRLFKRDVVKYGAGLAVVRHFGDIEGKPMIGLEISQPDDNSKGNGMFAGERWFTTKHPDCAVFLEYPSPLVPCRIEAADLLKKLSVVLTNVVRNTSSVQ